MNEVADRLFAAFSKRVGVANIREWEEQHAAFEESVTLRRGELQQQVRGEWGGRLCGGRGARDEGGAELQQQQVGGVCKVRESSSPPHTPHPQTLLRRRLSWTGSWGTSAPPHTHTPLHTFSPPRTLIPPSRNL